LIPARSTVLYDWFDFWFNKLPRTGFEGSPDFIDGKGID
jgi:hypothetical protein